MINPDFENSIHQRLIERDPVAPAELVEAYIKPLVRRINYLFPKLDDPDFVYDAVVDALLNYVQHPEKFDPKRGKLFSYLFMSARGDLLNKVKSETRRRTHEVRLDDVEFHPALRNITAETGNGLELPSGVSMTDIKSSLSQVVTNQVDKRLLELLLDGERKTECYAEVLGISRLDISEQRRQVKRVKDRLTKRIQRLGMKLYESKQKY